MRQRNFYHIGYGKAGSSTLQCVFFPRSEHVHFYGIQYFEDVTHHWPFEEAQRLCGQLVHPEYFDGFRPSDIAHIEGQKEIAAQQDKAFVFSNDHFSLLVAPEWSVGKMKELMPDGQVIVVLRQQQDILKSIYKYRGKGLIYVPKRFENRFVEFNEYFDVALKNYRNRGGHKARDWVTDYLRIIDYERLVNYYASAFGEKNVHILFFEDLARRPREFYRQLTAVLGVPFDENAPYVLENRPINQSMTTTELKYIKLKSMVFGNLLFTKKYPWLKGASQRLHKVLRSLRTRDIDFSQEQIEILRSLYAEGNRRLAQRFGVDLASRGYLT